MGTLYVFTILRSIVIHKNSPLESNSVAEKVSNQKYYYYNLDDRVILLITSKFILSY